MSDLLLTINNWIAEHQALVVALGVPVVTAMAAGIVSVITTRMNLKAQSLDRKLRQKLKLVELEQTKIDRLREALTQFESVTFRFGFDVRQGLSAGQPNAVSKEVANSTLLQIIDLAARIRFMVDPSDPDWDALSTAMDLALASVYDMEAIRKKELDQKLVSVGTRIIRRLEAAQKAILS